MTKRHATDQGLSNCLPALRKERELSQADLAEAAEVTRKTINTIENGVFIPSTVLTLKLAQVLRVRVEDIFSLDNLEDD